MRHRRVAAVVAGLALAAFVHTGEVGANPPESCVRDCLGGRSDSSQGDTVTSVVWETIAGGSGTASVARPPAWLALCTWTQMAAGEPVPNDLVDGEYVDGFEEDTWLVTCPAETLLETGLGDAQSGILAYFPVGTVPQPLIDALRREAYEQTPVVAFYPGSAPAGSIDAPLITRFPTWLFVDETAWGPVSATASIPPLSITATATPVETTWIGGDRPEMVTCGSGTAFDLSLPFEDQTTDCAMSWIHSSAMAEHELSLDVRWEVRFECSAICGAGPLPDIVTSSSRTVRVAEVQALVTEWGG